MAASFAFAQESQTPADSNAVASADSLLQQLAPTAMGPDSAVQSQPDSVTLEALSADSVQNDTVEAQPLPDSSRNCVTVDLTTGEIEPDAVNTPP